LSNRVRREKVDSDRVVSTACSKLAGSLRDRRTDDD
jgi:hypothetical protein